MKVTREFCDVCRCEVGLDKDDRYGIVVTFGYSKGGWGHRQNHVNMSAVVCVACYTVLCEDRASAWRTLLADRKALRSKTRDGLPLYPKAVAMPRSRWQRFCRWIQGAA